MDPRTHGLPAVNRSYTAPTGEEMLLFRGIEAITNAIRQGYTISPSAYCSYRKLITLVEALKDALDHREKMQGISND